MLRRFVGLVITPLIAAALLVAGASGAGATPSSYGPECATLSLSTTTPLEGASLTVSGAQFIPGAHVTILMHSQVFTLGHATADANGRFSVVVTLPHGVTGDHEIFFSGGLEPGCPTNPIPIDIGAQGSGGPGGGTSMTGVHIAELLAIALGLLGVGFVLNQSAGRRKRRQRRAHRSQHDAVS